MNINKYVTSLHKITGECQLDTMYDGFIRQALLLVINDGQLRRKLFNDAS